MTKTDAEYIQILRDVAENTKESLDADEFRPSACFYTDIDKPRLIFLPTVAPDRETHSQIGWAFHILASSLDDLWAISWTMDSVGTNSETRSDGSEWGPTGKQEALYDPHHPDHHLVYESLSQILVEVGGNVTMVDCQYTRDENGVAVFNWDEARVIHDTEDAKQDGFFPDVMRSAIGQPKIIDSMKGMMGVDFDDLGLTRDAARIHCMSIAAKMVINEIHMPVLIPIHNDQENEILDHSMTEGPLSENVLRIKSDDVDEIISLEQAFEVPAATKN